MGMIRRIRYALGFSGANFTRKEKDCILEAIREYEKHIMGCWRYCDDCDNMNVWLRDRLREKLNNRVYVVLVIKYHNYSFYRQRIPKTEEGDYMWSPTDFVSRQRACKLLRIAVIND